ncbi:prickle-like protein 4 [Anolis carolinensis]|uniref:prickle-like protein 4 n=1 Tax=Anolis carolinensis TaxID=28377 RepID=UPI002F2B30B6
MSQPSPPCSQREKAPCSGTLGTLLPVLSSDSDSGCALEDYQGPASEVSPDFGCHSSDAIPTATQNQLRIKTLLQQLPPQDSDERYCSSIGEEEKEQLRTFAAQRRQESLGQGIQCLVSLTTNGCSCKKCDKMIPRDEKVIFAPKLGEQFSWHPSCFVCHTCHEPLVDLIYFHRHGKIYCGRHHAEFFRPRCASCDQLIFTSQCMEAEGMRWHEEHFCCLECDLPLGACRYVMKGGQPCCCACFESLYADICQACGEIIGVDSEQATLQGQHWHAKTSCFCCSLCQKALKDQLAITHNGHLFCSEACSLEKESVLSFSGSDSSDSAFISAPSPDSTPLTRVRNSSPGCSAETAETSCMEIKGAEAIENLCPTGNSPVGPEYGNQEESDIVFRNKMFSAQLSECESLTDSPQKVVEISTSPSLEAWSSVGQREVHSLGATLLQAPQEQVRDHHFRSSLSISPRASVLTMDFPESPLKGSTDEQEAARMEQGDTWCPTCSSSSDSDSEPEGFFFGKPIPKPGARGISLPNIEQETLDKVTRQAARAKADNKHCSIA